MLVGAPFSPGERVTTGSIRRRRSPPLVQHHPIASGGAILFVGVPHRRRCRDRDVFDCVTWCQLPLPKPFAVPLPIPPVKRPVRTDSKHRLLLRDHPTRRQVEILPGARGGRGALPFRILNAPNARRYRFALDSLPTGGATPFTQIGSDGGLLARPIDHREIDLAPATRFDVIVDFSGCRVGDQITLLNKLGSGLDRADHALPGDPQRTRRQPGPRQAR